MSGLPPVGGNAQLQNAAKFIRDSDTVTRALQQMGQGASNLGQSWTISARVVDRASNTTVTSTLRIPRAATQAREALAALGTQAGTTGNQLERSGRQVDSFGKSLGGLAAAQRNLGGVAVGGAAAGLVAATAATVGLGAAATAMGAQFQRSFNAVGVFAEGSTADLEELRKVVFELGRGPGRVGVNELTQGLSELSRGGVSARDQINGAAEAVRNLVIASQGELLINDAAALVASTLKTFQLDGKGAITVVDALAAVAQTSTANFNDLALSIRQGGQAANLAGFSIQETASLFGVLSENALKGADAGTSFKSAFLALTKPSKDALDAMKEYNVSLFDAQGNILGARELITVLNRAFGDQQIALGQLTEQQRAEALARIFSSDGVRAAIALAKGGTEAYDRFRESTDRLTAANLAQKLSVPFTEQLESVRNNLEAIGVAIGSVFLPAIQDATEQFLTFIRSIDLEPFAQLQEAVRLVTTGEASIGTLVELIGQLAGADAANTFSALVAGGQAFADILGGVVLPAAQHFIATLGSEALTNAPSVIGDLVSVTGAAAGVFVALLQIGEQVAAGFRNNSTEAQVLKAALLAITAAPIIALGVAFGALLLKVALVTAAAAALVFVGMQIASAFTGSAEAAEAAAASYDEVASAAADAADEQVELGGAAEAAAGSVEDGAAAAEGFTGTLDTLADSIEEAGSGVEAAANEITKSFTDAAIGAIHNSEQIGEAAAAAGDDVAAAGEHIVGTHAAVDAANAVLAGSFIHNGQVISATSHAAASEVGAASKNVVGALGAAASATTPVGRAFASMGETIVGIAQGIANAVAAMARSVASSLLTMLGPLGEIPEVADKVQGALGGLARASTTTAVNVGAGLGAMLSGLGRGADDVGGAFDTLGTRIDNVFSQGQRSSDSARIGFEQSLAAMQRNAESFEEVLARIRARGEAASNAARRAGGGGGIPELGFPDRPGRGGRERAGARDRSAEQAARDLEAATKQANELFEDLSRNLERIERETLQRLESIARKSAEQINDAIDDASKAIAKEQQKSAEAAADAIEALGLQRATRARREAFDQQFKDAEEARERERTRADEDRRYRERADDEEAERALRNAREVRDKLRDVALEGFAREQEDAQIARRRAQEDEDDARRKGEEARKALDTRGQRLDSAAGYLTIGADRADAEEATDAAKRRRQRAREDEDRKFREAQAKALRDFREKLDTEERAKREAEDIVEAGRREHADAIERARRRFRDQEDRDHKKEQERLTREFEDNLDDEALARRLDNIATEETERVASINRALAERQEAVRQQTDQEIADILSRFTDQIEDLEGKFNDKVPEIIERGGAAVLPLVEQITRDLNERIGEVSNTIATFGEAVQGVPPPFDAAATDIKASMRDMKISLVESLSAIEKAAMTAAKELKAVVELNNSLGVGGVGSVGAGGNTVGGGVVPGFQHGGVVPGPPGVARQVTAHGGEIFLGMGRSVAILDAIRSLEARAVGSPGQVASTRPDQTINNHYSFEANYTQSQSPVTLDMDLRAILALTGR
jgi:TP901 family phage tail tape measure protein